jgi:hypothetical protein
MTTPGKLAATYRTVEKCGWGQYGLHLHLRQEPVGRRGADTV